MDIARFAHWFGPAGVEQFGWLTAPTDGTARAGVVLCPSAGHEYKNAHRTFRRMAEALAAAGFAALRYDHPFTGDSAGEPPAGATLAAWREGVATAVAHLRDLGCTEVAVVGMRLGATLAASEASRLGPLSGLVLWDPCLSGRAFLREQRALRAVASNLPSVDVPGFVEGPGSLLPAELRSDLPWAEGSAVQALDSVAATLVLVRAAPPDERLLAWLADATVEWAPADGQPELLEVPAPAQAVPEQTSASIVGWLDRHHTSARVPYRQPGGAQLSITDPAGRVTASEVPVTFGGGLFGVRTTPATPLDTSPLMLLVNVATEHHIGPGRIYVDIARRLAASGTPSIRFSLSGCGDSDTHPGESDDVVRLPGHFDDMATVIDSVIPLAPHGVIAVGLCSSAYQVLEAAMERPLAGVYGINPAFQFTPPETLNGGSVDHRRHFYTPHLHLVDQSKRFSALRYIRDHLPELTWRVRSLLQASGSVTANFTRLVEGGTEVRLLCGRREALALEQSSPRLVARLRHSGAFQLDAFTDLDHALEGHASRILATTKVLDWLAAPTAGSSP